MLKLIITRLKYTFENSVLNKYIQGTVVGMTRALDKSVFYTAFRISILNTDKSKFFRLFRLPCKKMKSISESGLLSDNLYNRFLTFSPWQLPAGVFSSLLAGLFFHYRIFWGVPAFFLLSFSNIPLALALEGSIIQKFFKFNIKKPKAAGKYYILRFAALVLTALSGYTGVFFLLCLYFIINPVAGIFCVTFFCMIIGTQNLILFIVASVLGFFAKGFCDGGFCKAPRFIDMLVVFFAMAFFVFSGTYSGMSLIITLLLSLYYLAVTGSINEDSGFDSAAFLYISAVGLTAVSELYGVKSGFLNNLNTDPGRLSGFYILSIPFAIVYASRSHGAKRIFSVISVAALFLSFARHIPNGMGIYKTAVFILLFSLKDIKYVAPTILVLGTILSTFGIGTLAEVSIGGGFDFGVGLLKEKDLLKVGVTILLLAAIYTYTENNTRKKALVRSAAVAIMGAGALIWGSGNYESIRLAIVFWVVLSINAIELG